MSRILRSRVLFGILGAGAAACLLYAAAGFFLAPQLIERRLATLVEDRLGQALSVEKIKVNPFTLSVEASGVRLVHKDGSPLLAARRIYLDLNLTGSGFGRGWVLDEAQVDGLQVDLELRRNGRLNFADLVQRWQAGAPQEPQAAPVRVTLRHLLARDGTLALRDVSGTPAATRVTPIRLELENVSTLPDSAGRYSVSARVDDGATLNGSGSVALPLKLEGDLALDGLKLATVWKFIRDDVRLAEPEGTLGFATHYDFRYAGGKPELRLTALRANASALRLVREGFAEPILALKTVDLRGGTFDFDRRALVVPDVSLADGAINVEKDAGGTWNWSGFVRENGTAPANGGSTNQAARAWHIDLNAVKVERMALRYEDRHRAIPLAVATSAIQGSGALVVTAGGDAPAVQASAMNLRVDKLLLPTTDSPAINLAQLRVEGGSFDLFNHELGADRILVDGGAVLVERAANGSLPMAAPFAGDGASSSTRSAWTYTIGSVRVQGLGVALSNRDAGNKPVVVRLSGVAASIDNITVPRGKPMAFKVSASVTSGGSLAANGSAYADLSRADAEVELKGLALTPLQPLIARYALVHLASGSASASAVLAYRRAGGKTALSVTGPFALDNVRLQEAGTDQTVLAWQRLSAVDARLTLGPDRLSIGQVVAQAPEMKFAISEKRELNVMQLIKDQVVPDKSGAAQPISPSRKSRFPVQILEVRLRDGTMNFSDDSLALPFATTVKNLNGTVSGLGTDRDQHAVVRMLGKIGEFGSARVDGSIDTSSPRTFTDIDFVFQNVNFSDLSPYTATFLGRKIASGKLEATLKYAIARSQLTGQNDITIKDFKLGEAVDSPTALKLPLDLAVALLTDSDGRIRAEIPVRGDLNNPQFGFGALIREALGSLIGKIVSAPFRALAAIFGNENDGEDLASIEFEHGSATLLPSEKEKLSAVTRMLAERPQLKLIVQSPYVAETDGPAMRQDMAGREIALALGLSLKPGEKPAPIAFGDPATQAALEQLVAKKAGTAQELADRFAAQAGRQPERVDAKLARAGAPDFYKSLYSWLLEAQPVNTESMRRLAASRASAVLEALRSAGADPARLESAPVEAGTQGKGDPIAARLSLEAAG